MIKNIKFVGLLIFLFTMTFQSCDEAEEVLPYQGTAIQSISTTEGVKTFLDFVDIANASAGFTLDDAGDVQANVIDIFIQHKTADPDDVYSDRLPLKSVSDLPSQHVFTSQELAEAAGVPFDSLKLADNFLLSFDLSGADGKKYFSSEFHRIDVSCPSDLEGTYSTISSGQSTDECCNTPVTDLVSEITLTEKGSGVYEISDFSSGVYKAWYSVAYGATDVNKGELKDVCNSVSFQNTTGPYGSPISGTGIYDPDAQTITIDWTADDWGDVGSTVMTKVE